LATRIDKLEMQGFKSFAKKTTVLFPSNFSIVCGPNGSGKSNILDSVCFVLGRKSAKSLRADKMMEVVFKGTQKLPPADFAKVSIYFDNRDKTFPYEDPQICVSRKVNAKGVSIYKINNETVTREKVIEVLRRANIHPDGHNIILQGDITDIIEMSPVERREIIDEISGISEFEEKREKAKRELDTVESRLNNSAIVLNERYTLLARLEAEKEAAEQYAHLTSELDKLRASKAKKDLANAEEAMSTLQKKIEERESEVALSDAELAKIDSELGGLEKRISRVQNKLMDYGKHIAVVKDLEAIRSEIFQKKAKADSDEFEIARINDLVKKLQALRDQQLEGNRAVQSVMRLGRTGVYGTVASLSQVPTAYQSAIEVCAGQHLFDIVADTADTAVECVHYLKENRIGRATFLPLDKIREREGTHLKKFLGKPGVVDIAINLIKYNQKYWHAFSHLFGDTLVVDSIDVARKLGIGEARFVTLDGDLVERSGAIIGGFYRSERKAFTESDDTEKYEAEKKRLAAEIESLHGEIKQLTAKLHSLAGEEQKGTKEVVDLQKERNDLELALDEMRRKRLQFFDHKSNAANDVQNLKINRARLEADLDNIKLEFQEVKKDVETYDLAPSTLQGKIRDVINKIQELGAINQKAVEEYRTLKVEYDELKNKVDVLTAERNRVLEIIAGIEGRRRETFMKTLDAVTKQFTIIFKELMKGSGTLRLEGDVLEDAGLIIEASPPGGKVLNIDSMSGGEKTMTALAFLFAVQEIKPAPFYILDEIDAQLDKPNTKKMTQFIIENAKRAQFVVISHNDTTIQAADCVYGVSKEDGESKLIGIKMPE
jgi:chromosome segregation protein